MKTTSDSPVLPKRTQGRALNRRSFSQLARTLTMTKFWNTEPTSTTSLSSSKSGLAFIRARTLPMDNSSPSITRGDPCSSCATIMASWPSKLALVALPHETCDLQGVQAVADAALPSEASVAKRFITVAHVQEAPLAPSLAKVKSSSRESKIYDRTWKLRERLSRPTTRKWRLRSSRR